MNTTTLFDLNQTASAGAISALGKDALATESVKLEAFTAAGHDRADFPQWEQFFINHVKNYTSQRATPSPATKAATDAASAATKSITANANKTQASMAATSVVAAA